MVRRHWYTRWYGLVALAIALALVNPFNWVEARSRSYHNDSRSMEPAIAAGDYFMAYRAEEAGTLDLMRGSIVLYRLAQDGEAVARIKRVVGLPGDRVAIRDGTPWVNGAALARRLESPGDAENGERTMHLETSPDGVAYSVLDEPGPGPLDEWTEQTVPVGFLFVLGDNRDRSLDSRVPSHGFVPVDAVFGTPGYVFWSRDLARVGKELAQQPRL
jgi:signal peptidase I